MLHMLFDQTKAVKKLSKKVLTVPQIRCLFGGKRKKAFKRHAVSVGARIKVAFLCLSLSLLVIWMFPKYYQTICVEALSPSLFIYRPLIIYVQDQDWHFLMPDLHPRTF